MGRLLNLDEVIASSETRKILLCGVEFPVDDSVGAELRRLKAQSALADAKTPDEVAEGMVEIVRASVPDLNEEDLMEIHATALSRLVNYLLSSGDEKNAEAGA